MKKVLLNWRYYVMFALFSVGFLAVLVAFGDEEPGMSLAREMFIRLCAAGTGAAFFYIFAKCIKYWESRNEIPEYTNSYNEDDDVWE